MPSEGKVGRLFLPLALGAQILSSGSQALSSRQSLCFNSIRRSNAVDVGEGSEQRRPRGDHGGRAHAPVRVGPLPGPQLLVAAGMNSSSPPPSPSSPAPASRLPAQSGDLTSEAVVPWGKSKPHGKPSEAPPEGSTLEGLLPRVAFSFPKTVI